MYIIPPGVLEVIQSTPRNTAPDDMPGKMESCFFEKGSEKKKSALSPPF